MDAASNPSGEVGSNARQVIIVLQGFVQLRRGEFPLLREFVVKSGLWTSWSAPSRNHVDFIYQISTMQAIPIVHGLTFGL